MTASQKSAKRPSTSTPTAPIKALLKEPEQDPCPEAIMLERLTDTALRANALFDIEVVPIDLARRAHGGALRGTAIKSRDPAETKLALLSLPIAIQIEKKTRKRCLGGDLSFERFDHFDLCVRSSSVGQAKFEEWCDELINRYQKAASSGAEYICTNELGYPSFWNGRAPISGRRESAFDFGNSLKALQQHRGEFERKLQGISSDKECIILPGTYHDPSTFENIAPIVVPYEPNSTSSRKYTSGYSAGEYIKVSRVRTIPAYRNRNTVFCLLICSDAFDLNIFFRHMIDRVGSDQQKNVEIFFVPSYYGKDSARRNSMLQACEQLSWITGSIVIFVDHFISPGEICKAVFMCGKRVWHCSEKYVSFYTINWKEFHGILSEWSEIRNKMFARRM